MDRARSCPKFLSPPEGAGVDAVVPWSESRVGKRDRPGPGSKGAEGLMGEDRGALGERCCVSRGGTRRRVRGKREPEESGEDSAERRPAVEPREEKRGPMLAEAKRMLGAGKTGERTEDIELKWPLGAHSSIPLSLP